MSPEKPPSDSLPFAWLKERLDSIERRMTDHNQAIRADMSANFAELRRTMADHADKDDEVESRVTVIETERGLEKQTATRHGAIGGSIAAGLVLGLVESLKKAFH